MAILSLLAAGQVAPGISARFGATRAVAGEDLEVRVEVEDGTGAVRRVRVWLAAAGRDGSSFADARPTGEGGWWSARFDKTLVPEAPAWIELRAELLGERGGLLLAVGDDEPHEVAVMTRARAEEEVRMFRTVEAAEAPLPVAGFVGVEARAGSNARARVVLGAAVLIGRRAEIAAGVSVGPAFSEPALLDGGGPMVIGFEAALRGYAVPPRWLAAASITPYAEGYLASDFRLPGVDPSAGARAGVEWRLGESTGIDVAVGGAVVAFRAFEPGSEIGFTGGARALVRFGTAAGAR